MWSCGVVLRCGLRLAASCLLLAFVRALPMQSARRRGEGECRLSLRDLVHLLVVWGGEVRRGMRLCKCSVYSEMRAMPTDADGAHTPPVMLLMMLPAACRHAVWCEGKTTQAVNIESHTDHVK